LRGQGVKELAGAPVLGPDFNGLLADGTQ